MKEKYFIGVDLGQVRDHSAIAITEASESLGTERDRATWQLPIYSHLTLRHLERLPLGTEYTRVAARVARVATALAPRGPVTVVVDATGVGKPVVEMLRREGIGKQLVPVVITGGLTVSESGGLFSVGKRELISELRILVERRELGIAWDLEGMDILVEEMAGMRASTLSGDRDDAVIALALAVWRARRGAKAGPLRL